MGAYMGATRIVPSPSKDAARVDAPASPPYHSGRIVAASPGRNVVIPSPYSPEAQAAAEKRRAASVQHTGVIRSRSLGYTAIQPVPSPERVAEALSSPARRGSPASSSKHPIRKSGDGSTTASPAYDADRGLANVPPRGVDAPVATGAKDSGIIVSKSMGYTKVIPSPTKLAAASEGAARAPSTPPRSPYASPIRATRSGSTTAGSLAQQLANDAAFSTVTDTSSSVMAPPANYLPHGTFHYVHDRTKKYREASFIAPDSARGKALIAEQIRARELARESASGTASERRARATGSPIRTTFKGYTTAGELPDQ